MDLHCRAAAYCLLLSLSACSSSSSAPTEPNHPDDEQNTRDVIYGQNVTDEALERLLDGTPKSDPRRAISLDAPDPTAPVPKGSPVTFRFHLASEATHTPDPRLGPSKSPSTTWLHAAHALWQLLAPERIAYAHGTPYNGTAYFLVIDDKASKHVLRVFTAETSFTPEELDWQHLSEAPQPLTLSITSADFDANSIPADGGPFVGGTFSFRIE